MVKQGAGAPLRSSKPTTHERIVVEDVENDDGAKGGPNGFKLAVAASEAAGVGGPDNGADLCTRIEEECKRVALPRPAESGQEADDYRCFVCQLVLVAVPGRSLVTLKLMGAMWASLRLLMGSCSVVRPPLLKLSRALRGAGSRKC